jgi:transposase InsO family protein
LACWRGIVAGYDAEWCGGWRRADGLGVAGVLASQVPRDVADVELAIADWVDWYNTRRLHTSIGGVPPAEYEAAYYAQNQPHPGAGATN